MNHCQRCLDVDKDIIKMLQLQKKLKTMIEEQIIIESVQIESSKIRIDRMKKAIDYEKDPT